MTERKGELAAVAGEIAKHDGNIISVATFSGRNSTDRIITVKVTGAPKEPLIKDLEARGVKVLNAVDTTQWGYATPPATNE